MEFRRAEPLTARLASRQAPRTPSELPLRHAGTFLCDLRLFGDAAGRPSRARALVVGETEAVTVDRDEVFLIEDWRLRPDGTAIAPGADPKDATPVYTVNGLASLDIAARPNERLRLRFINGCQRTVYRYKNGKSSKSGSWPWTASRPSRSRPATAPWCWRPEAGSTPSSTRPRPARPSPILLHDGKEARPIGGWSSRGTADPARSASAGSAAASNGLPAQLDLRSALRFELPLGGPRADWVAPVNFSASAAPAFRVKPGRIVVLALTNRADIASVFHLHGHHFRLLDRLDDGWKPFWLDTLAIEPGQTQRIAFLAEYPGRFLVESVATDWAAPRLVRWYSVG